MSQVTEANPPGVGGAIRRLGFSEAYFTEIQRQAGGTLLVVGGFGFAERIAPETLRQTLAALMHRFPLLRAVVSPDSEGRPVFVDRLSIDDIPITVLPVDAPDTWIRVFNTELQQPLDNTKGLWRATLIDGAEAGEQSWLVVAMDHAITDGTSWIAFAGAFDRAHAAIAAGAAFDEAPQRVHPPVEAILARSDRLRRAHPSQAAVDVWPHAVSVPVTERRTRYIHQVVGAETMRGVIAACHANHVTVNDLLLAALAKAIAAMPGAPGRFVIAIPHNVRDAVSPPVERSVMGMFVVEICVVVDRDVARDSDVWTLAAALDHQVRANLDASLEARSDYDPAVLRTALAAEADPGKRTFSKVVLSNLGVQKITPGADGLTVDRCYLGVSQRSGDAAFFVTGTTVEGALNLAVGACQPLVPQAAHDAVAARVVAAVTSADDTP